MSETWRGHLWEKIIVKLFASSWYIFLTYIYDARSHLYQILLINFHILLTVHHVMIFGKRPLWCTIFLFLFFNSLHVSSTSCSSSGETKCVNTTSGSCRWPCRVQVGSETSDLLTTRPPTQSDSYQRLYWHNLSLLMMSTMCSKHVES